MPSTTRSRSMTRDPYNRVTENNSYTFPCHLAIGWVQLLLNLQVVCKDDC